ncbi:thymidylate kinase [Nonomuraea fuscirosea]|uniref:thymidylate kinase n=1 Tax=Nonomuraea fuscirosea TaxID=1291556 RepID=UPI00340945B4
MTITPVRPSCTRGPLIAVEGITGVGKTYLTHHALDALDDQAPDENSPGAKPLLLDGFSQRAGKRPDLGEALLGVLREASSGDPFLRGGTPLAETWLLLAIKRYDLDTVIAELSRGRAVFEGRSVDTTAVCQALLLHPETPSTALETAKALLDFASSYRPLPDLTILITDDARAAIARTQQRDQRVLTPEQARFMGEACALYERLAATDPARYRVIDRRIVDEHQAAELIRAWTHNARSGLGCVCEPWQGPGAGCIYCGRRADVTPA